MSQLDLKQQWQELYQASAKQPSLVQVPALNYLMVDGEGDPRRTAPEKLRTILRHPVAPR